MLAIPAQFGARRAPGFSLPDAQQKQQAPQEQGDAESSTVEKTDAIAVALDHRDGYSVMVIYPYRFHAGRLVIEAPIAQQGAAEIFPALAMRR